MRRNSSRQRTATVPCVVWCASHNLSTCNPATDSSKEQAAHKPCPIGFQPFPFQTQSSSKPQSKNNPPSQLPKYSLQCTTRAPFQVGDSVTASHSSSQRGATAKKHTASKQCAVRRDSHQRHTQNWRAGPSTSSCSSSCSPLPAPVCMYTCVAAIYPWQHTNPSPLLQSFPSQKGGNGNWGAS